MDSSTTMYLTFALVAGYWYLKWSGSFDPVNKEQAKTGATATTLLFKSNLEQKGNLQLSNQYGYGETNSMTKSNSAVQY